MVCLECARSVRSVNVRHLASCCGLLPAEYRRRHPGAPLMDADVRAKCGRPLEKNGRWKGRTGRRCSGCGKTLCRRARGQRCVACRSRTGADNPFFGRRHDAGTRAIMSAGQRCRDPATRARGRRGPNPRISAARSRAWAAMDTDRRERLIRELVAAGLAANRRSSQTAAERIVGRLLDALGLPARRNVMIGRKNVDFLIGERLVVECFGDYWHCNPMVYVAGWYNKSLKCTAAEKWALDWARCRDLTAAGYEVFVIWERDLQSEPALVQRTMERIRHALH